jgi:hypothetical protein
MSQKLELFTAIAITTSNPGMSVLSMFLLTKVSADETNEST